MVRVETAESVLQQQQAQVHCGQVAYHFAWPVAMQELLVPTAEGWQQAWTLQPMALPMSAAAPAAMETMEMQVPRTMAAAQPRARRHSGRSARAEDQQMMTEGEMLQVALEGSEAERTAALAQLRGHVLRLSMDPAGCRAVQKALTAADSRTAAQLAAELRGHVRELLGSPHGNYVAQRVVEVVPATMASFVAQELRGHGASTARHRFGCRVLCRLLEHAAAESSTEALVEEILAEADDLIRHSFARHVVQSLLEHGTEEQQKRVVEALCKDLLKNVLHRNASYVVESALLYAPSDDQQRLAELLLADGELFGEVAVHQFGSYVARSVLQMPENKQRAVELLRCRESELKSSKHGKRVLEAMQ